MFQIEGLSDIGLQSHPPLALKATVRKPKRSTVRRRHPWSVKRETGYPRVTFACMCVESICHATVWPLRITMTNCPAEYLWAVAAAAVKGVCLTASSWWSDDRRSARVLRKQIWWSHDSEGSDRSGCNWSYKQPGSFMYGWLVYKELVVKRVLVTETVVVVNKLNYNQRRS